MLIVLRVIVYLALAACLAGYALSFLITAAPPRARAAANPSAIGLDFEAVAFTSRDGTGLKGWLVPHPKPKGVVVLSHGLGAERSDLLDMVPFLHRAGYALLLYDFRAHGESEGRQVTLGYLESGDLVGALDLLASRDDLAKLPWALYGLSMGAAPCILVAAVDKRVKAVVAESCYESLAGTLVHHGKLFFGMPGLISRWATFFFELRFGFSVEEVSPAEAIGAISPAGVLLIAGENDSRMTVGEAKRLYERCGEPRQLLVVPGAAHGQAHFVAKQLYEARIAGFLSEQLTAKKQRAGK